MTNETAGIIGNGRFGKLLNSELSKHMSTTVYDLNQRKSDKIQALKSDFVFFCVPISKFETAVKDAKTHIDKGTIVMDVCSVKEYPVKIMKKELKKAAVIGTHPMFGPDSYHNPKNRKIAFCPVRTDKKSIKKAKELMQKLGWEVIDTTPEQHDKDMAISLTLMHVIGTVFYDLQPVKMSTMNYHIFKEMADRVRKDSKQLLHDMLNYNNHAKKTLRRFAKNMEKWAK